MKKFYCFIVLIFLINDVWASAIILHAKNATVWLPQQTIAGSVSDLNTKNVTVHFNDSCYTLPVKNQRFIISLLLKKKLNTIWVEAASKIELHQTP